MIEAFFMILLALFHAVPKQFVTFSWTMAALLYFIISLLLKNIKYRYMALGTMICSAFYLFIVDLARIGIIYRVFMARGHTTSATALRPRPAPKAQTMLY